MLLRKPYIPLRHKKILQPKVHDVKRLAALLDIVDSCLFTLGVAVALLFFVHAREFFFCEFPIQHIQNVNKSSIHALQIDTRAVHTH